MLHANRTLQLVTEPDMNVPYSEWLHILSWAYLRLCFVCGVIDCG